MRGAAEQSWGCRAGELGLCLHRGESWLILAIDYEHLTTGAYVNLFQFAVVCVAVVAMYGCESVQRTPPVAINPTPSAATNSPVAVEMPESADFIGMEFELIPAGTFKMGEGDYAHEVTLKQPFKMGVHEVTQDQYEQVMKSNPSKFKGAENPVDGVSWNDAVEFCRRLSELPAEKAAGRVYRLPTEAEWEYACRAGTTTKYSFGDDNADLSQYGWYTANSEKKTHPVGSRKPNPWGLYDMHGNVFEWCQDWHDGRSHAGVTSKADSDLFLIQISRGGSCSTNAASCWSCSRYWITPTPMSNYEFIGFRVCFSPSGD